MYLFQDPRALRESLAKSFLLPILVLFVLAVFIPFLWHEHSIYTTQYVFPAMILPSVLVRGINIIIDHPKKVLDWILTGILLVVALPVLLPIAIISLMIVLVLQKFPRIVYFTAWLTAVLVIFLLGAWPKTKGSLPKEGTFVVAINHGTFLDYFFVALLMGFKKQWAVVYGNNLEKYPVLGDFLKRYGIGVDRNDLASRVTASDTMKEALAHGKRIVIFPEGTRKRSHQKTTLLEFLNGAFTVAVDGEVPVVPIVISGAHEFSCPDKPLPFSPCSIYVSFLEPIPSVGHSRKELKEITYQAMKRELIDLEQ